MAKTTKIIYENKDGTTTETITTVYKKGENYDIESVFESVFGSSADKPSNNENGKVSQD